MARAEEGWSAFRPAEALVILLLAAGVALLVANHNGSTSTFDAPPGASEAVAAAIIQPNCAQIVVDLTEKLQSTTGPTSAPIGTDDPTVKGMCNGTKCSSGSACIAELCKLMSCAAIPKRHSSYSPPLMPAAFFAAGGIVSAGTLGLRRRYSLKLVRRHDPAPLKKPQGESRSHTTLIPLTPRAPESAHRLRAHRLEVYTVAGLALTVVGIVFK